MPRQSVMKNYANQESKMTPESEEKLKLEDFGEYFEVIAIASEDEDPVEDFLELIAYKFGAPEDFDVTSESVQTSEAALGELRTSESNPIFSDDFTSTKDSEDIYHRISEGTVQTNPLKRAHPEKIERSPKRVKFEFENMNFEHPPSSVLQNWSMILHWVLNRIDSNYFKSLTKQWKTLMVKIGTWGSSENLSFHEISEDFKMSFKKLEAVASCGESGTTDAQEFIEQLLKHFEICRNVSRNQEREELWKEIISILKKKLEEILKGQVFTFETINDCFRNMARDIDVIC